MPLGPYSPALSQPIPLTLTLRGEKIVGVAVWRDGYCRRGVVALAENRPADALLALVERSCALAGQAHRLAACLAIEAAAGMAVSPRAGIVRALFAEAERALARLWLLGRMARAAGLSSLDAGALEEREALFDAMAAATGERAYWAVAVPGGVRAGVDVAPLRAAAEHTAATAARWRAAASASGPLGRLGSGIGVIGHARARELGLRGLVARAAGPDADVRRSAPYAGYAALRDAWPADRDDGEGGGRGDVAARAAGAARDLATSADLMRACLRALPEAGEAVAGPVNWPAGREGRALVEGPHGPVTVGVRLAPDGRVGRLTLEPPDGALLGALPELLAGRPVGLAPLVLASLDLCLECLDL